MFNKIISIAIGAALISGVAVTSVQAGEVLDREKSRAVFTGATGTHWYLSRQKDFQFNWKSGGNLIVTSIGAEQDEAPYSVGTWYVKEVEKTDDLTDEEVQKANDALRFTYCQLLESMWSGNEMCWEVQQVTFDKDADKNLLPQQEYKFYREKGAETGGYIITQR